MNARTTRSTAHRWLMGGMITQIASASAISFLPRCRRILTAGACSLCVLSCQCRTSPHVASALFCLFLFAQEARKILAELEEISKRKYVSQAFVAAIFAELDDKDSAFAALERAYAERNTWMLYCLSVDPRFDNLRGDARFQDLRRRVGFID